MKFYFLQVFNSYNELIQTGEIQSTAEGDKVFLDIRGNLTGDILVFIAPAKNSAAGIVDINELIQSDSKLEETRVAAFKILWYKFKGLTLLPEGLVWLLNSGITAAFIKYKYSSFQTLCVGTSNLSDFINLLPVIMLAIATPFLAKFFGHIVLKPFMYIIFKLGKPFRKAKNKKLLNRFLPAENALTRNLTKSVYRIKTNFFN